MADYKAMYLKLFNEVTDVIHTLQDIQVNSVANADIPKTIEICELTLIIERLQNIQTKTEDMFIDSEE